MKRQANSDDLDRLLLNGNIEQELQHGVESQFLGIAVGLLLCLAVLGAVVFLIVR